MASSSQIFNGFASNPDVPFFCRVVDKASGFDIELFDLVAENAWACSVTPKTLELYADVATKIPLEKVNPLVKLGLKALGSGLVSEEVVLDMIEKSEELVVLQLRLRFGMEGCFWTPTLHFVLQKLDAEQREKLELQASIASIASELSKKATDAPIAEQNRPSPLRKGLSFLCSVLVILIAISVAIVSDIGTFGDTTGPPSRGIAFASVKPYRVGTHSHVIYWEPSSNFDDSFFNVKHSKVQVTEAGFAQVSIMLRHSNCRSDIAFKVYHGLSEIASVYDYTCGLFSIGISTTYVHTIPVDVNDTLSVKYVGGGTLYMIDSFMDVFLLPPTTQQHYSAATARV
ncbi:hypothetical protein PHYPSEUDO_014963 [Phytophthora pseudosyringae]|uniref:Uncharacterized protein n=1 Tax=Phytophthora pseudosyringae TaxID=221518 RepID=A0A8T1V6Y6_9STRA|nr:hypothetical protein PHYPSEUDO_014963 [Phytophthora pseudosyringae]